MQKDKFPLLPETQEPADLSPQGNRWSFTEWQSTFRDMRLLALVAHPVASARCFGAGAVFTDGRGHGYYTSCGYWFNVLELWEPDSHLWLVNPEPMQLLQPSRGSPREGILPIRHLWEYCDGRPAAPWDPVDNDGIDAIPPLPRHIPISPTIPSNITMRRNLMPPTSICELWVSRGQRG
jgi:hypothetical protein